MAPPRLSHDYLQQIISHHQSAVADGCIPVGGYIGTGKQSARTWIGRHLNLTEHQVAKAFQQAIALGMFTPQSTPSAEWTFPKETHVALQSGCILVGGDLHAWPGAPHPIFWAFCILAERLKPKMIVLNGDIVDGARISRHPRGRVDLPTFAAELAAAQELLGFITPAPIQKWALGNHDLRFHNYLCNSAIEMDGLIQPLNERFPDWEMSYAVVVNHHTEIRHRFRSGIHAAYQNALNAGRTMVTSHTHQEDAKSVVNRNGRHWGVEVGMLGDPNGAQFEYGEGQPNRAHPGFAVLTFDEQGRMLPPEKCTWQDGAAVFRGERVKPRIRVRARS